MATATDQSGYALFQPAAPAVARAEMASGWGSAAYVIVFVVVFIILIAILAAFFWNSGSGSWKNESSDDSHHGKEWNFNFLAGLIIFIIVILFLCWLLSSFGGRHY